MLGIPLSLVKARRGVSFFQPLKYWWQVDWARRFASGEEDVQWTSV
jgi:hypothetical protein